MRMSELRKRPNIIFYLLLVFFISFLAGWSHLRAVANEVRMLTRIIMKSYPKKCGFAFLQSRGINQRLFYEHLTKEVNSLRKNLDPKSNKILDYLIACIQKDAFLKNHIFKNKKISFSESHHKHELLWEAEMKEQILAKTYPGIPYLAPEVFYFHHGLRFADQRILNYIKDKDILDCGAFVGDSVLVLRNYMPKMIYCYEFSKPNIESFKKTMQLNKINSGYKLITKALGKESSTIRVDTAKEPNAGEQLKVSYTGDHLVNVTTIDEEAEKYKFNVGFMKVDVEGAGLDVIKGAINTIKQQRPILSIAVYHNNEELFGIKPFLESQLKNYVFEFQFMSFELGEITELILFCYPKELTLDT